MTACALPLYLQALVKAEHDLPRYQNGLIDPEENKHKKITMKKHEEIVYESNLLYTK